MSINYFKGFAQHLRDHRDDADIKIESIAAATRMKVDWIKRIESADLDFAPKVFISGYLRKYAHYVGLDPDDVIRQYELILQKIDYVAQDGYIERSPLDSNWTGESLFSEEHRAEINPLSVQLDEEINKKIEQERKDTRIVMSAGGVLIVLCLFYILFDKSSSKNPSRDTAARFPDKSTIEMAGTVKLKKPLKRSRWDLSEPLLTEQEKLLKDEQTRQVYQNRTEESKNLLNSSAADISDLKPISVQEAALELEQKLTK
jgi:hypothetical protein